jgi:hypothetical protein
MAEGYCFERLCNFHARQRNERGSSGTVRLERGGYPLEQGASKGLLSP